MNIPIFVKYVRQPVNPVALEHINEVENGDPHWDKVTLLLDSKGPGVIKDYSKYNNTVTLNSSYASDLIKKHRQYSIAHSAYANGLVLTYNTSLYDWWTEDCTIEGWNYITSLSGTTVPFNLLHNGTQTSGNVHWGLGQVLESSKNKLGFGYYSGSMVYLYHNNYPALVANTWYHFAFVHKKGMGIKLFVNGIPNSNSYMAVSGTPTSNTGYGINITRWNYGTVYGYYSNIRMTKGVARYTDTFIPPKELPTSRLVYNKFSLSNKYTKVTIPNCPTFVESDRVSLKNYNKDRDVYWNNVSVYLKLNQNFLDSSKNAVTITDNNTVNISNLVPPKFNFKYRSANFLQANKEYLSMPNTVVGNANTNVFTIEFWAYVNSYPNVYPTASPNHWALFGQPGTGSSTDQLIAYSNSYKYYYIKGANLSGGSHYIDSGVTVPLKVWAHVVLQSDGTYWKFFINGKETNRVASSANWVYTTPNCTLGQHQVATYTTWASWWDGNISNFRITKGIARYKRDFTPPLLEYPTM